MINNPEKRTIENEAIDVPRERVRVIRRAKEEALIAFEVMGITNRHYMPAPETSPTAAPQETKPDSAGMTVQPTPETGNVEDILAYAQRQAKTIEEQSSHVEEAA